MGSFSIRRLTTSDREDWQRLWEAYLDFYEASLPDEHTELLWSRLIDPEGPVEGLLAELEGSVVGIVHFFPHSSTWEQQPVCYLQDLYVDRSRRGQGVGERLIHAVRGRAQEEGWASVYWQTAEDNSTARGLYDKLTGGVSGFVVYELDP